MIHCGLTSHLVFIYAKIMKHSYYVSLHHGHTVILWDAGALRSFMSTRRTPQPVPDHLLTTSRPTCKCQISFQMSGSVFLLPITKHYAFPLYMFQPLVLLSFKLVTGTHISSISGLFHLFSVITTNLSKTKTPDSSLNRTKAFTRTNSSMKCHHMA